MYMKTKQHLLLGAMAMGLACTLGACQNDGETVDLTVPIDLSFTPGVQTRATIAETGETFEAGDRVGVFITQKDAPLEVSGNYVNNAALTFDGSQWKPERTIYWDGGTYNIYGYYPYLSTISSADNLPFSVATDQSTAEGYEASDFLWAQALNTSASSQPVNLTFSHRMSRMLIQLVKGEDYEDDLPEDAAVYLHNTVPDATIDLSAGVVTRDPYATAQSLRARSLGNHRYAVLTVPQRLDNRQPLVEVVMQGVSYLYESKFVFKAGIQHTVQLVVSKNPEQIKIEIGGELENWSN